MKLCGNVVVMVVVLSMWLFGLHSALWWWWAVWLINLCSAVGDPLLYSSTSLCGAASSCADRYGFLRVWEAYFSAKAL